MIFNVFEVYIEDKDGRRSITVVPGVFQSLECMARGGIMSLASISFFSPLGPGRFLLPPGPITIHFSSVGVNPAPSTNPHARMLRISQLKKNYCLSLVTSLPFKHLNFTLYSHE